MTTDREPDPFVAGTAKWIGRVVVVAVLAAVIIAVVFGLAALVDLLS